MHTLCAVCAGERDASVSRRHTCCCDSSTAVAGYIVDRKSGRGKYQTEVFESVRLSSGRVLGCAKHAVYSWTAAPRSGRFRGSASGRLSDGVAGGVSGRVPGGSAPSPKTIGLH